MRRYSWWVQAVSTGNIFFTKYRGPFGGSQMSGGGIIILRVIRRHFLACGRGPSCRPLHVQSTSDACRSLTTLTTPRREHHGGGRGRGLGRGRRGAGEDAVVEARTERSTRVHWFGCGVRLPSPQGLASGGNSRGGEFSAAAQPAMGGRSTRHDRRWFVWLEQED